MDTIPSQLVLREYMTKIYVVEELDVFRMRYAVKANSEEEATQLVERNRDSIEMSQKYVGPVPLDVHEVTEDEYVEMLLDECPYYDVWPRQNQLDLIFESEEEPDLIDDGFDVFEDGTKVKVYPGCTSWMKQHDLWLYDDYGQLDSIDGMSGEIVADYTTMPTPHEHYMVDFVVGEDLYRVNVHPEYLRLDD